jgi:hypothetical protein
MNRTLIALIAVLLMLTPCARAQTTYRPPGGHWSITVPAGWKVADDKRLQEINDTVAGMHRVTMTERIQYVVMLVPAKTDGKYALVQWSTGQPAGASFDSFVKGTTKGMNMGAQKARNALPDQIAGMSFDAPVVDRERQRLYLPATINAQTGENIRCISCPRPGVGETLTVHCYSTESHFDQNRPELIGIIDSFTYDPGSEYTFSSFGGFSFPQAGIAGLLGGLGGLVIWGVRRFTGRR